MDHVIPESELGFGFFCTMGVDVKEKHPPIRPSFPHSMNDFCAKLEQYSARVLSYEDPALQQKALKVIPVDQIRAEAQSAVDIAKELGDDSCASLEDAIVEGLLLWFKRDFFKWVDKPECWNCGSGNTKAIDVRAASSTEAKYEASRVEEYGCGQCGASVAFPRYNNPGKLLETRKGRCGEWANCFTLCCRAMGIEARWVNDWADHVWSEYYSKSKQRWVHLDPCESACDQPLLYESGWGKQLAYVIGFDRYGAVDLTRRYVKNWFDTVARRKEVSEEALRGCLTSIVERLRSGLDGEKRGELEKRDAREQTELLSSSGKKVEEGGLNLPGRQTGSVEWRASRGESGTSSRADRPAGTRYSKARRVSATPETGSDDFDDFALLEGGGVRASGENPPSETVGKAFDGQLGTKWLDFGGGGESGSAWIEYCLLKDQQSVRIVQYSLTSADDSSERDPCCWTLVGMPEGNCGSGKEGGEGKWVVLDERRDVKFESRHARMTFAVNCDVFCRRVRLRIRAVANPKAANSVQLAGWDLYGTSSKMKSSAKKTAIPQTDNTKRQFEERLKEEFDVFTKQGMAPNEAAAEAVKKLSKEFAGKLSVD